MKTIAQCCKQRVRIFDASRKAVRYALTENPATDAIQTTRISSFNRPYGT